MGRGRRDVSKTQRALMKILAGVLYKTIAYEEDIPYRSVFWIKGKYTKEIKTLELNDVGRRLMAEEQLTLPLHRTSILRVDHRLRNNTRRSHKRQRPRSL